MSEAPKRGQERPRKHENPRATKLQYDRERKQKLMKTLTTHSDDNKPSIPSVKAILRVVCTFYDYLKSN